MKKKSPLKKILLYIFFVFIFLFILSLISFFIDDKRISHSKTQTWKSFYALNDWNISLPTIGDYDLDGNQDFINWDSCAYITSVDPLMIPNQEQCKISGSLIKKDVEKSYTGQRIGGGRFTFLVKTQNDKWRFYSYNGFFQVGVTEINKEGIFIATSPSALDYIDNLTYMASHIFQMYSPI